MQVIFTLTAQVAGFGHSVSASNDGTGIVVHTTTGTATARSVSDAARIAARDLALYLRGAERPGVPWGLRVEVGGVAAVYGEFPLYSAPADPSRRPERSPVMRIRDQWHDGAGPLAALENALRIIDAYTGRRAAA